MKTVWNSNLSRRKFIRNAGLAGLSTPLLGSLFSSAQASPDSTGPLLQSLPERAPRATGKKVLVIGAGMAGLSAATELKRAGYQVQLLEARSRPGGRVRSISDPYADGLTSELGAVVFSDAYKLANRYIDEFGLKRIPFAFPDLPALYHVDGKRFSVSPGEKPDWPYALTAEEAELGPIGIVVKYLAQALPPEIANPGLWNTPALRELDGVSLADFLRGQGASEGAIRLIGDALYFGWDSENASALSIAVTDIGLFFSGAGMFVLEGGNQTLPNALALRLSNNIQYGVVVKKIQSDADGIQIRAKRSGREETYTADHLICTVPATVLQNIEITPKLPQSKEKAIQSLPYHEIVRAQMQVGSAFWRDEGVSGSATTDLFGGRLDRQPYGTVGASGERAILDALVIGKDARKLGDQSDDAVLDFLIPKIEKIHLELRKFREATIIKRWNTDPYTMGGWSWPQPGYVTGHMEDLRKPHGRIHFAGEHTSILRATMEGALRSGLRAAREIDSVT